MRKADLDMVTWLRERIAEDVEQDRQWLGAARRNGKATARERLAQRAAHTAILDLHDRMSIQPGHPMFNDAHLTTESMVLCQSCEPETMFRRARSWPCRTAQALAVAYQHRPGYREEWRPQ